MVHVHVCGHGAACMDETQHCFRRDCGESASTVQYVCRQEEAGGGVMFSLCCGNGTRRAGTGSEEGGAVKKREKSAAGCNEENWN